MREKKIDLESGGVISVLKSCSKESWRQLTMSNLQRLLVNFQVALVSTYMYMQKCIAFSLLTHFCDQLTCPFLWQFVFIILYNACMYNIHNNLMSLLYFSCITCTGDMLQALSLSSHFYFLIPDTRSIQQSSCCIHW